MKRLLTVLLPAFLCVAACSTQIKVDRLRKQSTVAGLTPGEDPRVQEYSTESVSDDTLKVIGPDGREVLIMKTMKDENGETVATAELSAAVITTRFRNVAERHGQVEIRFDVSVPAEVRDSRWQIRFTPVMSSPEGEVRLDQVKITGKQYRKAQLRGYQKYERFLSTIITDSTRFIRRHDLEVFLRRNMPQIYALRQDSTFVSDEQFATLYGVSQQQAVQHYKNRLRERANRMRWGRKDRMYARYVKVPISGHGMRLDTVVVSEGGDFVYEYVQAVKAAPGLRKLEIALEGEIYEEDRLVYSMPSPEPLTYYISSLSTFVDDTPRYLTRIVERSVRNTRSCRLDFAQGRWTLDPGLGENAERISELEEAFRDLSSDAEFSLDSIVITASCSPEGRESFNRKLSRERGRSVRDFFRERIPDSLRIVSRENAENWSELTRLVCADSVLSSTQREEYLSLLDRKDPDEREASMARRSFYPYLRNTLYPRLRTVDFDFYLSRRWMQKDTVHTTVLDSLYMSGVQAIKDREYQKAIEILSPYDDFNTAVALSAADRDWTALDVLGRQKESDKSEYLSALLYSRVGEDALAVQHYLKSCALNPSYVHRGNLDPEISSLISKYNLNNDL